MAGLKAGLKTCTTTLGVLALAAIAAGCASTGASGAVPVPKPFPMPGSTPGSKGSPGSTGSTGSTGSPRAGSDNPSATPESRADTPASRRSQPAGVADAYALVGTALDLRGAPYRDGGADPRGFDCSGFTQYVFGQHGLTLPRAVRDQFKLGKTIGAGDLEPGDLLFFTTTEPGASHVAITVGTNQFIHAPSSTGVVRVERLSSSYWSQRFVGARRLN